MPPQYRQYQQGLPPAPVLPPRVQAKLEWRDAEDPGWCYLCRGNELIAGWHSKSGEFHWYVDGKWGKAVPPPWAKDNRKVQ